MRTFFVVYLFLCAGTLFAQNSASDNFNMANIKYEHNGVSPYEIRFTVNSDVTNETFWHEFNVFFKLGGDYTYASYSELNDDLGQTHYRFNQYYKNIEVVGAQFILHEENGFIQYANGHLVHNININVNPLIDESSALRFALSEINAQKYMWEDPANEEFIKREQNNPNATYYPIGILMLTTGRELLKGENVKLVYRFDVYADSPVGRYFIDVDAKEGSIINITSLMHSSDIPGTGTSLYNGNVNIIIDSFTGGYRLRESGRGGGIQTYDMHNTTNFNNATDFIDTDTNFTDPNALAGVSLHWAIEGSYDYYLQVHGRNSVDGNGFTLRGYAHYDDGLFNAYWDGSRLLFGDGGGNANPLTSIDVAGHELTHGVTQYTAGLIYQDESGALNESFSDIFGTAVEFYLEGVTADWLIGEDFGAIRSMENPNAYDDPDTYFGSLWAALGGPDFGGVHTNSGVQNFWFYLLTEGGSGVNDNGDPYSVTGIGLEDAAKIAYRNLSVYLTPSSPFFDARLATINSATDLFGIGTQQYQSALDAWFAVGVYQPYLERTIGVSDDSLEFLAEVSLSTDSAMLIVSNIGLEPLTINDIQLSGNSFQITSLPTLPLVLNNFEDNFAVTIVFTPTEAGMESGIVTISSDDAVNPNKIVYLKGKGFKVDPALQRVLYASSGLDSDGKILTIDLSSGQGNILGASQFEEVKSIAIHPSTKFIYGLISENASTKILRVNATMGDAYLLHEIDLGTMAGIAFDKNETLYGISIFGEVYTIDLSDGSYSPVVDANTSVSGISFHPLTNELWASSRGFVGPSKDKIFKIDLSTGDITLIGNTGLQFMTNDIAFDEKLKLYGLVGGSGQLSDLVEINTSNGEGTIIGSVGFENVIGLAYLTGAISSVNNEEQLPTVFALEQNYPNPFNPTTTINYQLPESGMVSLKVFNMLGEEIATLVNHEVVAGVYNLNFDAINLSSGVYFYTLKVDDGSKFFQTNKMILLK